METNPYAAPQSILNTPADDQALDTGISETELIAFAGAKRYPQLLMRLLEGKSRHAGFNVWAAIFGVQWFFYRKLYFFGIVAATTDLLFPFVAVGVFRSSFGHGNPSLVITIAIVFFLLVRIGIGYMANIALCLKASKVIKKIDSMNKDNEAHLRLITSAGGVSIPSLLIVYLVLGVFRAL